MSRGYDEIEDSCRRASALSDSTEGRSKLKRRNMSSRDEWHLYDRALTMTYIQQDIFLDSVHEFLTADLLATQFTNTFEQCFKPTRVCNYGMRSDFTLVEYFLNIFIKRSGPFEKFRLSLASIRSRPSARQASDTGSQDPIWFDDLTRLEVLGEGIQGGVVTARAAQSGIAELHGGLLRDAVDRVLELVVGVLSNGLGTVWRLVVEGRCCAV